MELPLHGEAARELPSHTGSLVQGERMRSRTNKQHPFSSQRQASEGTFSPAPSTQCRGAADDLLSYEVESYENDEPLLRRPPIFSSKVHHASLSAPSTPGSATPRRARKWRSTTKMHHDEASDLSKVAGPSAGHQDVEQASVWQTDIMELKSMLKDEARKQQLRHQRLLDLLSCAPLSVNGSTEQDLGRCGLPKMSFAGMSVSVSQEATPRSTASHWLQSEGAPALERHADKIQEEPLAVQDLGHAHMSVHHVRPHCRPDDAQNSSESPAQVSNFVRKTSCLDHEDDNHDGSASSRWWAQTNLRGNNARWGDASRSANQGSVRLHSSLDLTAGSSHSSVERTTNAKALRWNSAADLQVELETPAHKWAIHPDHKARFVLDLSALAFLCVDVLLVPYQIAWDIPFEGWTVILTWLTFCFWLIDLFTGFISGYWRKGELVMDKRRIAKHYLKKGFFMNALACAFDGCGIALIYHQKYLLEKSRSRSDAGNIGFLGKLPRLLKLHRAMRLYRVMREGKATRIDVWLTDLAREFGAEDFYTTTSQILKIVFLLLWINHLGACVWRAWAGDAIDLWYIELGREQARSVNSLYDYLVSYFVSTAALLAGEAVMTPLNETELVLSIAFVVFGLICGSITIGIITESMLDMRMINKDRDEKRRLFRKYAKQAHVPYSLANDLERQAMQGLSLPRRVVEDDVSLLKSLTSANKMLLNEFSFGPAVCANRFIRACSGISKSLVESICSHALSCHVLKAGDRAFERGEESKGAYMVFWGSFDYITSTPRLALTNDHTNGDLLLLMSQGFEAEPSMSKALSIADTSQASSMGRAEHVRHSEPLQECRWICQLSLFCHVEHLGTMQAIRQGEYLTIRSDSFGMLMSSDPKLLQVQRDYALGLVNAIQRRYDKMAVGELSLPMPHESILPLMSETSRVMMSQAGLDIVVLQRLVTSQKQKAQLFNEVSTGQCDLVVESQLASWGSVCSERVLRVVSVAVLRLERQDGRILCQIGKIEEGKCVPGLKLPGIKVGHDELPHEALDRLVEESCLPMKAGISTILDKNVSQELKNSKSYAVQTKYIRSEFIAKLDPKHSYPVRIAELDEMDRTGSGGSRSLSLARKKVSGVIRKWQWRRARANLKSPSSSSFDADASSSRARVQSVDVESFLVGAAGIGREIVFAWLPPEVVDVKELREIMEESVRRWVPLLSPHVSTTRSHVGGHEPDPTPLSAEQ